MNKLIFTQWTDPTLTMFVSKIKTKHIEELRDATNFLEGKTHDIFSRIGFGTIEEVVVSLIPESPMSLRVEPVKAYFPDGSVNSFDAIIKLFDNPSVVTHTNEVYTSVDGNIKLESAPITDSTGLITGAGVTVNKVSDGTSVTISSIDPDTGAIKLDLAGTVDVRVNYKSSKQRYDVLYISSDGTNAVVKGSPVYSSPVKPEIPEGTLELCTVLIKPKHDLVCISLDDVVPAKYGVSGGGSGSGIIVDDTEPAVRTKGMFWLDTNNNILKYWDGVEWVLVSGSVIMSYYDSLILDVDTGTVNIPLIDLDANKNPVYVFQNSVFLAKNVDYTVSANGKTINKISGTWSAGTELDFIGLASITIDPDTLTLACLESSFTATVDDTTHIPINNPQYSAVSDVLQVYYNNMMLFEGDDYTVNIDGISVDLVQGIATGEKVKFIVWKKVRTAPNEVDGSVIMDGTVLRAKLAPGVTAELDGLANSIDAHLADEMPHQLKDITTNKIYKYGIKQQDGHLIFAYQEVV